MSCDYLQDPISGEYITEYRAIAQRYLQGWFAVDVLATLPVDYIVRGVQVSNSSSTALQDSRSLLQNCKALDGVLTITVMPTLAACLLHPI